MAVQSILPPMFHNTGANKEPPRGSLPVGPAAAFLERDFVILGPGVGAPQVNGTLLAPPASLSQTIANAGGSIAAGTYYSTITYLNANGETTQGPVEAFTTTGTGLLTVQSPPPSGDATGWRLYLGTAAASASLFRSGATVAIGTSTTASTIPSTNPVPTTNTTGLAAPTIPSLSAGGSGGPAGASTVFVTVTYVNAVGETVASPEASQALTSGQLVTVTSPAVSGDATGYNVYAANISGQEVKQTATPIAIGTNWTEPTTGLVTQGVQRAAANQPGLVLGIPVILGLADHDYLAVYGGPVGGVQPGAISDAFGRPQFDQNVFGITEYNLAHIPQEPKNAHFLSARALEFDICLKQAWDPGYVGQPCGLAIDSTTNAFIADLTATNGIFSISGTVDGPGWGVAGDTNKRIRVRVLQQFVAAAAQ